MTLVFLPASDPLRVPNAELQSLTVVVTHDDGNSQANALITGYEVFRFGVPMIGEYDNAHISKTVTISPVVPGAQYRVSAWALYAVDKGRRSANQTVVSATTRDARKSYIAIILVVYINRISNISTAD